MTYQEFEKSLLEILNDNSDITIGNDMSVNTRITVREDGQVFITEYEGFRRVERIGLSGCTPCERKEARS